MGFAGVRLYDARTGRVTGEIKPVDYLGYPVFSPDGRIVAWGDRAHDVRLHDAVSGRVVRTLSSRRGLATAGSDASHLLFSPDGDLLISYLSSTFGDPANAPTRVFHVPTGREVSRFYLNPEKASRAGRLSAAACSPDGRLLAVAEEESGTIRL